MNANFFSEMYVQYADSLGGFFRRRGVDYESSLDLVQETFLKAYAARDRYEDRGFEYRRYLYRIAHNLLVDYWRTHRKTWALEDIGASYTLRFDEMEQRAAIRAAVDDLRPAQRAVIVGRFYDRLKHREMGHISTLNGCKKLQDRALANLRRALEAA